MVSFKRPTGAAADLNELEYIAALQQTQDGVVRKDGSVQKEDIQLFLKSRYGILASLDDIERTILKGFGDDDVIDLSEMVAMLLIPTLLKSISSSPKQEGVVYPSSGLVDRVVQMILRDVTGSSETPTLSTCLLRDILVAYGEEEVSQDADLLAEMMNAAGNEGDAFNSEAFSKALTHDVQLYNVNDEVSTTTNYHDVMSQSTNQAVDDLDHYEKDDSVENGLNHSKMDESPAKIRVFWSSPAIDFTASRYSSKLIVILLWSGFIMSYLAYIAAIIRNYTSYFVDECQDDTTRKQSYFGCRIFISIIEWSFILSTLCAFGLGYVALGSIGNGIEDTRKWTRLIALFMISGMTWGFFFAMYRNSDQYVGTVTFTDEDGNVVDQEEQVAEKSESYEAVVHFLALIIGNMIIFLELFMMLGDSIRKRYLTKASDGVIRLFTATGIKAEAGNKRAAALKMNALVDNALDIHSFAAKDIDNGETSFGAGLLSFSVRGQQFEEVGGFLWTWKRIWSRDLFETDGVWISARIMAGNFAQLLISIFVLTFGIAFTQRAVEEWERGKTDPAEYLYIILDWFDVLVPIQEFANSTCDLVLNVTNGALSEWEIEFLTFYNTTCTTIADQAINDAIIGMTSSLYPQERYMVEAPLIIATVLAFLSTLALVVVYVPSVASTTLQFRTGCIPFFHDEYNFELYRTKLDRVTILLGSMFWSCLYAAALVGILVGLVVFLLLWQATRTFFFSLLAIVIALVSTLIVKILFSIFLLRKAYAAFYRRKLNQANILSLAVESIMVGFAIATALARAAKIILISALYIGRLDTPLLASGVGVGALADRYPDIFRQDILALEAHRHPYIDLIGKLYLLKLRHGGRFANRAGYFYRLIFTVALLPWVRKY